MGKFNLRETTRLVKYLLEHIPETRSSDDYLYYCVCVRVGNANGFDINTLPFWEATIHRDKLGIPARESVRRARQKLQHAHPELCGTEQVEAYRLMREKEFYEYAREAVV